MVPEGWHQQRLDSLVSKKISYGIVQAGPHVDDGVPYLKSSDIGADICPSTLQRTAREIHHKYRRSAVHPGDIVFSLRGNTGATSIVPAELPVANLTQGTARISAREGVDRRFLRYQLANPAVLKRIMAVSKGSTFKEISLEDLRSLEIPLPMAHAEQEAIGDTLAAWDRAIAALDKLVDNSETHKRALARGMLARRRVGVSWKVGAFDNLFEVANQKTSNVPKSAYRSVGRVPVIDQGQAPTAAYTDHVPTYSDVPVIVFGDHTRTVKWVDFEFCPGADGTQVIRSRPALDKKFAYYLISEARLPNLGYSRHMRELKQMEFRYPVRLDVQRSIADALTKADEALSNLRQQRQKLALEKAALMQQLLTGRRRLEAAESRHA